MDNYMTYTTLLGLKDSNLPLYKETRLKRYKSVEKMVNLLELAKSLHPSLPSQIFRLNFFDPEWDDVMPFPVIDRRRVYFYGLGVSTLLYFYSYNYNAFTHNIRFRSMRFFFPLILGCYFGRAYYHYRRQVLKVNLFDEYCWLRTQ
eukprot:GHVR01145496.1.p1 GENE.GHVR01145496.1~~GHVR01145496.1.p1  ORF type:complete len:146 (+),score=2.08 GHVR01145496.1:134-571(+)